MAGIKSINVEAEFDKFFKAVIAESRQNLKFNKASGALSKSLNYDVTENKNSITASFLMEDYGDFIDKGVRGTESGRSLAGYRYTDKKPPVKFLRTWLKRKSGRFRSRNLTSDAFRVQNIVYRKGIKPTEFYSKPFEKYFKTLPEEIIDAYGLDVEDFMEFVLKD